MMSSYFLQEFPAELLLTQNGERCLGTASGNRYVSRAILLPHQALVLCVAPQAYFLKGSKIMRIAQIAPLHEAVPPKFYGGTERVVSFLTEELVSMGHDVTLFASGDSITSGRLYPVWPRALRLDPSIRDPIAPHMLLMEEVYRQ